MIKLISKVSLGLILTQFVFAQPQTPSTANEAQILMFNPQAQVQSNNPVRTLEPTQPRTSIPVLPQVSDTLPHDQNSNEFKEYKRMEDTTTKPCTGSQDCAMSETKIDNPMNQQTVDLADPKTRPDIGKVLPQINAAGKAAQKNDDTPR